MVQEEPLTKGTNALPVCRVLSHHPSSVVKVLARRLEPEPRDVADLRRTIMT